MSIDLTDIRTSTSGTEKLSSTAQRGTILSLSTPYYAFLNMVFGNVGLADIFLRGGSRRNRSLLSP